MPDTKTKLYHTCPTEEPFQCMTGELSDQGFLVVVDKSTHELVVRYGVEEGTITVLVNPKGARGTGVSVRPGTRLLDFPPSSADPMQQAAESLKRPLRDAVGEPRPLVERCRRELELFWRRRRGAIRYALTLHPDGSAILMIFDGDAVAMAELSDPMVEQLIEQLRSRDRGRGHGGAIGAPRAPNRKVLSGEED